MARWFGPSAPPERIDKIANANEEMNLPCVEQWVHRLHEDGWQPAIAPAAPRASVRAILEGTTRVVQGIVSAEDVQREKPDLEVYLTADSRVGVSPNQSIVVEHAAAGIERAPRAGKSIGVNGNGAHLPLDFAVQSLELLDPNAFETLLEGRAADAK